MISFEKGLRVELFVEPVDLSEKMLDKEVNNSAAWK
jgi:hypothetical protein